MFTRPTLCPGLNYWNPHAENGSSSSVGTCLDLEWTQFLFGFEDPDSSFIGGFQIRLFSGLGHRIPEKSEVRYPSANLTYSDTRVGLKWAKTLGGPVLPSLLPCSLWLGTEVLFFFFFWNFLPTLPTLIRLLCNWVPRNLKTKTVSMNSIKARVHSVFPLYKYM